MQFAQSSACTSSDGKNVKMTRNDLIQLCASYGWIFQEDKVFCYQQKNYMFEWVRPWIILIPGNSEPLFRWMVSNENIFQKEYNENLDLNGYVLRYWVNLTRFLEKMDANATLSLDWRI